MSSESIGVTTIEVYTESTYGYKKYITNRDRYEVVDFDQYQRDMIHKAIKRQKEWLQKNIEPARLKKMLEINPVDIIEMFEGAIQTEINALDSVEKFFLAHRPYRKLAQ